MNFESAMREMRKGKIVSTGERHGYYFEYVYRIMPWCSGEQRMARYIIDHSERQAGHWECNTPGYEEILSDKWSVVPPSTKVLSDQPRKVPICKTI